MEDQCSNYQMLEELGSGSFGVVYKAIDRTTGELVAIKHIDLDGTDDDIRDIQQEIAVLSACASPFVTHYKTSFVRGVKLWIVMEYLGGGSCLDMIKMAPCSEVQAAIIVRELLLGLDYLHNTGKIHRDIKAANILLSHTGKVKIADFGVAAQLTNIKSQRMTFVGTPFWMAPEVIQEEGYDYKADIWSLGITTIELIQGEPPHADQHPMKALFQIPKNPAPRLEGPRFSRELKSFVAACLVKDPAERPSARDLLQHRFIQKAGRTEIIRDLVAVRQNQKYLAEQKQHPKFYEETLRDMSPTREEDDWVFDTIRPSTAGKDHASVKKRKLSETIQPVFEPPIRPPPGFEQQNSFEPPVQEMMQLDLTDASLEMPPPPVRQHFKRESVDLQTVQRRPSFSGTARKVSTPQAKAAMSPNRRSSVVPAASPSPSRRSSVIHHIPAPSPSRRQSVIAVAPQEPVQQGISPRRRQSVQQQPAKPPQKQPLAVDLSFGNSPSNSRPFRRASDELSPTIETPSIPDENVPPAVPVVTKEGKLGRKAFSRIIDPSMQEMIAQTANGPRAETMYKVSQAWAAMDALDPEGEYLLFKLMLEKLQNDPKLANLIMPGAVTGLTRTPSGTPQKPKLVLAQNNPHLKSHRRRQSSQVSFVSAVAEKPNNFPGQTKPGMDHTKQLAEALYARYAEGLQGRWPHPQP